MWTIREAWIIVCRCICFYRRYPPIKAVGDRLLLALLFSQLFGPILLYSFSIIERRSHRRGTIGRKGVGVVDVGGEEGSGGIQRRRLRLEHRWRGAAMAGTLSARSRQ